MIVFDLSCPDRHVFEGWFGSTKAFEEQRAASLIACPMCGSTEVAKAPMAPNVAAKGDRPVAPGKPAEPAPLATPASQPGVFSSSDKQVVVHQPASKPGPDLAQAKAMISALANAQAKLLEKSEWVGDGFAKEARSIHYGEGDDRLIHGSASRKDAEELREEGIGVAPLPLPVAPPDKVN